jgi:hypothetical protein
MCIMMKAASFVIRLQLLIQQVQVRLLSIIGVRACLLLNVMFSSTVVQVGAVGYHK